MSVRVMSRVWDYAPEDIGGSELLVLLALADFAGDDGICWPSVKTIARKSRISERQVKRILHRLADLHLIEVVLSGGGRKGEKRLSNRYRVTLAGILDSNSDNLRPVTPTTPVIVSPVSPVIVSPVSPKPSVNHHIQPSLQEPENLDSPKNSGKKPAPQQQTAPLLSGAIVIYRETFRLYPNVRQKREIEERVSVLALWQQVCDAWALRGYKPTNVAGMLDWYEHPEKMQQQGWMEQAAPPKDLKTIAQRGREELDKYG
jgi:hypothetical protein